MGQKLAAVKDKFTEAKTSKKGFAIELDAKAVGNKLAGISMLRNECRPLRLKSSQKSTLCRMLSAGL